MKICALYVPKVVFFIAGNLLILSCEIGVTWTSPVLPKLSSNDTEDNPLGRPITSDEESWLGSLLPLGAAIGSLPFGILADKIGRRCTLLLLGIPHLTCYLILSFANEISLYYLARILTGISVGASYTVLPMYIGEIASKKNRGGLSSSLNIFITGGDLIPYAVGPFLPVRWFNVFLITFPVLFLVSCAVFSPETPYYRIIKKNEKSAEDILVRLRSKPAKRVQEELREIKESVERDGDNNFAGLIKALKESNVKKGVIISLTLVAFQQLSGITPILLYTETLFESTGSSLPAWQSSLILGAVQFVISFVAPAIVDRTGRKPLLLLSGFGMFVSEAALGTYLHLQDNTDIDLDGFSWLPIACLVVYIIVFNCGFGPLPYAIIAEVFPSNVKGAASSACSFTCWVLAFVVSLYFSDLGNWMGISGVFWLFSGFCFASVIFVVICVPETKGKSFQEIQAILAS